MLRFVDFSDLNATRYSFFRQNKMLDYPALINDIFSTMLFGTLLVSFVLRGHFQLLDLLLKLMNCTTILQNPYLYSHSISDYVKSLFKNYLYII